VGRGGASGRSTLERRMVRPRLHRRDDRGRPASPASPTATRRPTCSSRRPTTFRRARGGTSTYTDSSRLPRGPAPPICCSLPVADAGANREALKASPVRSSTREWLASRVWTAWRPLDSFSHRTQVRAIRGCRGMRAYAIGYGVCAACEIRSRRRYHSTRSRAATPARPTKSLRASVGTTASSTVPAREVRTLDRTARRRPPNHPCPTVRADRRATSPRGASEGGRGP